MTLPWSEVPAEEKVRLKRNEAAQRRETAKRDLPAVPVSVEGLWLIQRGCCACDECRCEVPLVVGDIVIAHRHFRAGKGSPGHVPHNVQLWSSRCNKREAAKETVALGRGRRHTPDVTRTKPKKKASGSFWKPANRKSNWPKGRKIPSRRMGR